MSVRSVAKTHVDTPSKLPKEPNATKVSIVAEDNFSDAQLKQPTRNTWVYHLQAIPETEEALESPPQASTSENKNPPATNPNTGLALRKLAALKEAEAKAKRNLK